MEVSCTRQGFPRRHPWKVPPEREQPKKPTLLQDSKNLMTRPFGLLYRKLYCQQTVNLLCLTSEFSYTFLEGKWQVEIVTQFRDLLPI